MATGKTRTTTKVPHTDILHEIEEHLTSGFLKLKEALGEKKIKNRFKKVVKILSKGFGDDKPKKKKSPARKTAGTAKVANAAKVVKKTAEKVVEKKVKAVKKVAKKAAKKVAKKAVVKKATAVKKAATKKAEKPTEE